MKRHIKTKLNKAHSTLGLIFPDQLFDFICRLDKPEVKFGGEEWLFWTVTDKPKDEADNFIIERSANFEKEWGLNGLVFAANGIGDYLVVLPLEFGDRIFVMMHETAEIKLFGEHILALIENGPENYLGSDNFIYKLDDDNKLIRGEIESDEPGDFLGEDYQLRSYLDDLIDDHKTEKASDIIIGLEKLRTSEEESHKIWALNKLSDIYLKGFGPIPKNMTKALDYNQQAIDLNSHLALSNRAACYFFGLGIEKDIQKAFELATKANELSKANQFADLLATRKGGGMYDNLVDMIKAEIDRLSS
jgi:hypothetical protein